jgi:Endonuclease/Exonuclease/phosphatase family
MDFQELGLQLIFEAKKESEAKMKRNRKLMVLVAVSLFALSAATLAEAQPPADENRPFSVMTWNLYVGAPLDPLFTVTSPDDLLLEATAIWETAQQTNFYERAEAISEQIALKQPDLIGLQEAVLWRLQSPGDFVLGNYAPNADEVVYDFIEILRDDLEARGLHYDVLAVVEGEDFEGPVFNPYSINGTDDIRVTDRDAILARSDVRSRRFEYSNVQGGNFETRITLDVLGLPVEILSNWASVDVHSRERTFRFVTTHLSALSQVARVAQVGELLSGPLGTDLPVILAGDLNSDAFAAAPAYEMLASNGFGDTWQEAGTGDGSTWGQDGDLLNAESALDQRIDVVLYRGDFRILRSDVVGEQQKDRTSSGLWPSDHAGVDTQLMFNTTGGQ